MIRRKFLSMVTLTGVGSVAALSTKAFAEKQSVTYIVTGFTCVTCATGLETLLEREKGILAVRASYPDGQATITFDARSIAQADILKLIESMGFTAKLQNS